VRDLRERFSACPQNDSLVIDQRFERLELFERFERN
jgi:hypothetical protein